MLPSYLLSVEITATSPAISQEQFREKVAPSLAHLDALKGAFDRSPCIVNYCQAYDIYDRSLPSVRAVVMISVGKKRAEFLLELYQSIAKLIELELSHLQVATQTSKLELS